MRHPAGLFSLPEGGNEGKRMPLQETTTQKQDPISGPALDRNGVSIKPVGMKNITVSVDDEIYHRARVRAAERRTSVSAIVRRILEEVAAEETEVERLKRLERETIDRIKTRGGKFSASSRLPREEIHGRHAIR